MTNGLKEKAVTHMRAAAAAIERLTLDDLEAVKRDAAELIKNMLKRRHSFATQEQISVCIVACSLALHVADINHDDAAYEGVRWILNVLAASKVVEEPEIGSA